MAHLPLGAEERRAAHQAADVLVLKRLLDLLGLAARQVVQAAAQLLLQLVRQLVGIGDAVDGRRAVAHGGYGLLHAPGGQQAVRLGQAQLVKGHQALLIAAQVVLACAVQVEHGYVVGAGEEDFLQRLQQLLVQTGVGQREAILEQVVDLLDAVQAQTAHRLNGLPLLVFGQVEHALVAAAVDVQRLLLQHLANVHPGLIHIAQAVVGDGQVVAHIGHVGILCQRALEAIHRVLQVAGVQRGLSVHAQLVQLAVQLGLVVALGNVGQRVVGLIDELALRLHLLVGAVHGLGLIVVAHGHEVARHAEDGLGGELGQMKQQLDLQIAALVQSHAGIGVGDVQPEAQIVRLQLHRAAQVFERRGVIALFNGLLRTFMVKAGFRPKGQHASVCQCRRTSLHFTRMILPPLSASENAHRGILV